MTEQTSTNEVVDATPAWEKVKYLTSSEGTAEHLEKVEDELAETQMQHIGRLSSSADDFRTRSYQIVGDWDEKRRLESIANRIDRSKERTFGNHTARYFDLIRTRNNIDMLEENWYVGEEAEEMIEEIVEQAPNNQTLAESHVFVDSTDLQRYKNKVDHMALSFKDPVKIPRGMFIGVDSFGSWYGRDNGGFGLRMEDRGYGEKADDKGTLRPSRFVIEDYATRDTELPATEDARGFVLPDGRIYFQATLGSHRTAAAIRRDQEFIELESVTLYALNEVPPALDDPRYDK